MNRRALVYGSCAGLVVLLAYSYWLLRRQALSSQGTVVGDYWVPDLRGWNKEVYRGSLNQKVTYSKIVEGTSITVVFVYFPPIAGMRTEKASLRNVAEIWKQILPTVMQKRGSTSQILFSRPSRYRSWAAHFTKTRDTEGAIVTESQFLDFVDGIGYGRFGLTFRGRDPHAYAKHEGEDAWKFMTKGLYRISD